MRIIWISSVSKAKQIPPSSPDLIGRSIHFAKKMDAWSSPRMTPENGETTTWLTQQ
jgi:hypothetical protein